MKKIVVVGGAHVDRRGRIRGAAVAGASNPGTWHEEPGGGGFNAARNLARLGYAVTMIAPRGGDAGGEMVAKAAEAAGLSDMALTFLDRATPTYTAILNGAGDLVIALADMALYDLFSPRQLSRRSIRDALVAADGVLCDANLPEATLTALAARCQEGHTALAAIAVSPAKVVRLQPALERLSVLFMNEREAEALCGSRPATPAGWPALLRGTGLRAGIVTGGAAPAIAFDATAAWSVTPPPLEALADVTGAGDALAAAAFAALLEGEPIEAALRRGMAAAGLAVTSPGAVPETLDRDTLAAALPLVPQAAPLH